MGFVKGFEKATSTDSTGRTLDAIDMRGTPQEHRAAVRALLALQQRDELISLQKETNALLQQLLSRP